MQSFARRLIAIAIATGGVAVSASAAPTWQVQADFLGSTTRSLRGIALSPDDSQEYLGFIQGTSGTTAVREYGSGILTPTNPAITNSVTLNGFQPKGVAVDDRGNVYATYSNASGAVTQKFRIFNSNLSTLESEVTTPTGSPSFQLGGIAVQDIGGTYYAYVGTNKGTATIQRYNVTNPAAPTLDTGWATGGVLDLKATQGANAFVNGMDIAPDGTIYATGGVLGTGRGDKVFKISADGSTISSANVTQAMDVALYQGNLYVAEYNSSASAIDVLSAADLSTIDTYTTGFPHAGAPGNDDGYSGITVSSDGKLYVSDQIYGSTGGTQDRVLVSSPVPEPASLGAMAIGCGAILARRRMTQRGA